MKEDAPAAAEPSAEPPPAEGPPPAAGPPPGPKPPEEIAASSGCWPRDEDFRVGVDPYSRFSISSSNLFVPAGPGLRAFLIRNDKSLSIDLMSSVNSLNASAGFGILNKGLKFDKKSLFQKPNLQKGGHIGGNKIGVREIQTPGLVAVRSGLGSTFRTEDANLQKGIPSLENAVHDGYVSIETNKGQAEVKGQDGQPVVDLNGETVVVEVVESYTLTIPTIGADGEGKSITVAPKDLDFTLKALEAYAKSILPLINPRRG